MENSKIYFNLYKILYIIKLNNGFLFKNCILNNLVIHFNDHHLKNKS